MSPVSTMEDNTDSNCCSKHGPQTNVASSVSENSEHLLFILPLISQSMPHSHWFFKMFLYKWF